MFISQRNAIGTFHDQKKMHLRKSQNFHWTASYRVKFWRRTERCANILKSFQGDYIWIEPISGREFDVAIGARVISAEGRRIQVKDDDNKVL